MWSGLGHHIIRYMDVNALEERSGPSSTVHCKIGAVHPDQ